MWFDIIKESRQTSRTVGSIDWENEAIPEEEENNCKKWLKGLYDIMNKYQDIDYGHPYAYTKGPTQNIIKLDKIPENLACAIKDFYTENDAHEIDTNMVSLKPFFKRYGVDEEFIHETNIGTYLADYFQVDILLGSLKGDETLLHAGPSFSWGFDNGPFQELLNKTEYGEMTEKPYSKEVEERVKQFLKGEDKLSKRICGFIKEFYEYIKKPEMKDYFKSMFAWAWANLYSKNYGKNSIDEEMKDSFKIAVERYF